jgi:hypothetical protein
MRPQNADCPKEYFAQPGLKCPKKMTKTWMQKKSEKVVHFQTKAKTGGMPKIGAEKTRKTGDAQNPKPFKMSHSKNEHKMPSTLYKRGTKRPRRQAKRTTEKHGYLPMKNSTTRVRLIPENPKVRKHEI